MGVEELDKPMHEPCAHLSEDGCGRYATRPEECRAYHCAWRNGHGGADERPDLIGMVTWFPAPGSAPGWDRAVIAAEVEPGASERPDNWYRLTVWRQRGMAVVMHRRASQ